MDQATPRTLLTICKLRYQNSGPGYPQYRLYFSTEDTQQILGWRDGKIADLAVGKYYRCWVYPLSDQKAGFLAKSVCLIKQHQQIAINANVGTFLRRYAERWDAYGRPNIDIEASLAVADGSPTYNLMLGLGLPEFALSSGVG